MSVNVRDARTASYQATAADLPDGAPAAVMLEIVRNRMTNIVGLSAEGALSALRQLFKIFHTTPGGTPVTHNKSAKDLTDVELDKILGTSSSHTNADVRELIELGAAAAKMGDTTAAKNAADTINTALAPVTERKTDPAVASLPNTEYTGDDVYFMEGQEYALPAGASAAPAPNGTAAMGYPLAGTVPYKNTGQAGATVATGENKPWEKPYTHGGGYQSYQGGGGSYVSSFHKCKHKADPVPMGDYFVYAGAKRDFTRADVAKVDVVVMLTQSLNTDDFKDFWGLLFCFPIQDMSAPDPNMLRMQAERIAHMTRTGSRVMVFCEGGHGRTGTVLATVLGLLEPTVIDPVLECRRRHCSEAVETAVQVEAVFKALGRPLPEYWVKPPDVTQPAWSKQGKFWSEAHAGVFTGQHGAITTKDVCDVCKIGDILNGPKSEFLHWHGSHIRHDSCHKAVMKVAATDEKIAAGKKSTGNKRSGSTVHSGTVPQEGLSRKERKRRLKSLLDKTCNPTTLEQGEDLITCPACNAYVTPDEEYEIVARVGFHAACCKDATDSGIIEWYLQAVLTAAKTPKLPMELEFTDGHPVLVNWETGASKYLCACPAGVAAPPCVMVRPDGGVVAVTAPVADQTHRE